MTVAVEELKKIFNETEESKFPECSIYQFQTKHWLNDQTLFVKHLLFAYQAMCESFAASKNIVRQVVIFAGQYFSKYDKQKCLTNNVFMKWPNTKTLHDKQVLNV